MSKFDINPFDRTSLSDHGLLAGRVREMSQVKFVLRVSTFQENHLKSILLTGGRGVGKTSFLNLIEADCSLYNIIPVRLNVTTEIALSSNDFFWHMFNQIVAKMFKLNLLGGKSGDVDVAINKILLADGITQPINWFFRMPILRKSFLQNPGLPFDHEQLIQDLKLIRSEVCKSNGFNQRTKICVLIDEAQFLYNNRGLVEALRFILQTPKLGIAFVFAGDSTFERAEWEGVFGGSHRDFEIVKLDYFDDPDAVEDYFRKSLRFVHWTDDEIENKYFYRFKRACSEIFMLTSGRPAWINTIALKMFERCMRGDVRDMRFDRHAQADVKNLLKGSEGFDNDKLDFIENLNEKERKWLSAIFNCELSTLRRVYFYTKFKYADDNFMTSDEYRIFCGRLVENGIISLAEVSKDKGIGFKLSDRVTDELNVRYVALLGLDTMKQWLQISSNGQYSFSWIDPEAAYFLYLCKQLSSNTDLHNLITHKVDRGEEPFRASIALKSIAASAKFVLEETFTTVSWLYKLIKRINARATRHVMFGRLKNKISGKQVCWNAYILEGRSNVGGYHFTEEKLKKYVSNVAKYNTDSVNWELEIEVDKLDKFDISLLQETILSSEDRKLISIVVDDKSDDLIKHYIKDRSKSDSFDDAMYLYKIYEMGFELRITSMNNIAYVCIEENKLDVAEMLLMECDRRGMSNETDDNDMKTIGLAKYNMAILNACRHEWITALSRFKEVLELCREIDAKRYEASALKRIELSDDNSLEIREYMENNTSNVTIDYKAFAEHNIEILEMVTT